MERDDDVMVNKSLVNKGFILWLRHFIFLHGQSDKSQAGKMLGYPIGVLVYSLPRRRS